MSQTARKEERFGGYITHTLQVRPEKPLQGKKKEGTVMTNKQHIENLKKLRSFHITYADSIDAAIKALEQQKEWDWTPVTKDLPELNKSCFLMVYHRVCYGYMISKEGRNGVFQVHDLSGEIFIQKTTTEGSINAWMYVDIPDPYNEEE